MNVIQVEQQSYEMPPREGISIAHVLTVVDIDRSARFYAKVFGGRILSLEGHELRAATIVPGFPGASLTSPAVALPCALWSKN